MTSSERRDSIRRYRRDNWVQAWGEPQMGSEAQDEIPQ